MRKNEPTAAKRVATPIPFYDLDGSLLKNQTFLTASNEVFVYKSDTNTFVAANGNATELGGANASGCYFVQFTQAEVNKDTVVGIKLVKAGYADQFWWDRIDNTPDVNVLTWLDATPAALSTNGYLQTMLMRWLTDNAAGTPLALLNNRVQVDATAIRDAVLDALLSDHAIVGSVADGIAIAAGLLQSNFFIDSTVNTNPNGQTVARMRVFRTSVDAAAATDGGVGEGEFATFDVITTYTGVNKIATHRVVRQ